VVVVRTRTGRDAEVHFNPVPGTDLVKLRASLQSLISFPSNLGPEWKPTFGSRTWVVSPQYNAVYRKIAVATDGALSRILSQIKEAADEMDHHPIIVEIGKKSTVQIGEKSDFSPSHICIVCTTHKPPGLSLRDAHLAAKINTIIEPHKIYALAPGRRDRQRRAFLHEIRRTTRQEVEASVQKATQEANENVPVSSKPTP
jgi:pterin-4a-carbinolamine dehydratase